MCTGKLRYAECLTLLEWRNHPCTYTAQVKKMGWTHQWANNNVLCTCDMKTIHLSTQTISANILSAVMMQVLNQKENYTMFL